MEIQFGRARIDWGLEGPVMWILVMFTVQLERKMVLPWQANWTKQMFRQKTHHL